MKVILVLTFLSTLALSLALPQVGHGSPNGPSGRFPMTRNWASPPIDLSKPIIFLPEATPIHEAQESRNGQIRRRKSG
ncbi:uncharacterized protein LOC108039621 [Drosophila rhopaloa]|uniref:Uncharacterized protein LOC108039621 n=1 Tax=Drosophila rhopaloa TaxID=1041015 RepID=A0A6P4EAD9_DRORH|nr:uncharacterized protein LOC108039621 [Drosophila rhopaloa]